MDETSADNQQVHPAETAVDAEGVVLAGFWKRAAAMLIDGLILGVVGAGLVALLVSLLDIRLFGVSRGAPMDGRDFAFLQQLAILLLPGAYHAGFHASRYMATPGKMMVGIKVVRPTGERITIMRAIGRYFGLILGAIPWWVGSITAAFTQRKQALHDLLCDTLVVDKWAFTEHPERQRRELGLVTIVTLVVGGIALLSLIISIVLALIAIGQWIGSVLDSFFSWFLPY